MTTGNEVSNEIKKKGLVVMIYTDPGLAAFFVSLTWAVIGTIIGIESQTFWVLIGLLLGRFSPELKKMLPSNQPEV